MENSIIYGKHAVLLACKVRVETEILRILVVEKESLALFPKILHSRVEVSPPSVLNKFSQNHNGFVCITKQIATILEHELYQMQNIIALDGVQDIGNIGAILRSAAAFGVQAVIYTKDKMPNIAKNPSAAKLSSGGLELIKLCEVTNLHRTLQNLQKEGFWVIGTDANGEPIQNISKQYKNTKNVIVFGNEENGIKLQIRKSCDVFTSIAIDPQIGSLNVAAAGAIIMWEMFAR